MSRKTPFATYFAIMRALPTTFAERWPLTKTAVEGGVTCRLEIPTLPPHSEILATMDELRRAALEICRNIRQGGAQELEASKQR